jgi:hypothetical protein
MMPNNNPATTSAVEPPAATEVAVSSDPLPEQNPPDNSNLPQPSIVYAFIDNTFRIISLAVLVAALLAVIVVMCIKPKRKRTAKPKGTNPWAKSRVNPVDANK